MSLILFCALVISAWASPPSMVARIQSLVLEKDLSRLEDVLPYIPEDLRSHFTLVYAGNALIQSGPDFPGVILFGGTARTLLAFNGNSRHRGYNALDVLEYDEASSTYKPTRFWFSPTEREKRSSAKLTPIGNRGVYIEKHPRVCAACHGPQHHPIFEQSYPLWPGFYGSNRDHLFGYEARDERLQYESFLKRGRSSPRYAPLIFPDERHSVVSPFLDMDTEKTLGFVKSLKYRPNLMMGAFMARRNSFGLLRTARQSPYYERYKALLAFLLQPCDVEKSGMDGEKLNVIESEVDQVLAAAKIPKTEELRLGATELLGNEYKVNRQLGAKIVRLLGVRPGQWNLARQMEKTSTYRYWSGYGGTKDFLHTHLTRELFGGAWTALYNSAAVPMAALNEILPVSVPKDPVATCQALCRLSFGGCGDGGRGFATK